MIRCETRICSYTLSRLSFRAVHAHRRQPSSASGGLLISFSRRCCSPAAAKSERTLFSFSGRPFMRPSPCRCAALVDDGGPRSPCWQLWRACPQHHVDRLEHAPRDASSDLRNMCLKVIQWWGDELDRLGVDLRLGEEGSPADVVELQPSVTLLATGSRPIGAATDSALPAARIRGHSPGWSHQRPFCYVFQPVL